MNTQQVTTYYDDLTLARGLLRSLAALSRAITRELNDIAPDSSTLQGALHLAMLANQEASEWAEHFDKGAKDLEQNFALGRKSK